MQLYLKKGIKSATIDLGGNIYAMGRSESDAPWKIGLQDPDKERGQHFYVMELSDKTCVTSGSYERYFEKDGKIYHHIIDPETLYPGKYWRSVSIVCEDSGLADALSTALFLLPLQEGQALLDKCDAEALWLDADGQLYYSPGFQELIKS